MTLSDVEFHLLRGPEAEDHTLYASHTVWESKRAFEDWTRSEAFRKAHAQAGGRGGDQGVGLVLSDGEAVRLEQAQAALISTQVDRVGTHDEIRRNMSGVGAAGQRCDRRRFIESETVQQYTVGIMAGCRCRLRAR